MRPASLTALRGEMGLGSQVLKSQSTQQSVHVPLEGLDCEQALWADGAPHPAVSHGMGDGRAPHNEFQQTPAWCRP